MLDLVFTNWYYYVHKAHLKYSLKYQNENVYSMYSGRNFEGECFLNIMNSSTECSWIYTLYNREWWQSTYWHALADNSTNTMKRKTYLINKNLK